MKKVSKPAKIYALTISTSQAKVFLILNLSRLVHRSEQRLSLAQIGEFSFLKAGVGNTDDCIKENC